MKAFSNVVDPIITMSGLKIQADRLPVVTPTDTQTPFRSDAAVAKRAPALKPVLADAAAITAGFRTICRSCRKASCLSKWYLDGLAGIDLRWVW